MRGSDLGQAERGVSALATRQRGSLQAALTWRGGAGVPEACSEHAVGPPASERACCSLADRRD